MPADEVTALMEAIMAAAERQFEALLAERGIDAPGVLAARPPNAFEGYSHLVSDAYQFTTGYDSGTGTTTMPFMTDVSILTDGTSGDILTGS